MYRQNSARSLLCGTALALIASCGGGGGGSAPAPQPAPPPPPPPPALEAPAIDVLTSESFVENEAVLYQAVVQLSDDPDIDVDITLGTGLDRSLFDAEPLSTPAGIGFSISAEGFDADAAADANGDNVYEIPYTTIVTRGDERLENDGVLRVTITDLASDAIIRVVSTQIFDSWGRSPFLIEPRNQPGVSLFLTKDSWRAPTSVTVAALLDLEGIWEQHDRQIDIDRLAPGEGVRFTAPLLEEGIHGDFTSSGPARSLQLERVVGGATSRVALFMAPVSDIYADDRESAGYASFAVRGDFVAPASGVLDLEAISGGMGLKSTVFNERFRSLEALSLFESGDFDGDGASEFFYRDYFSREYRIVPANGYDESVPSLFDGIDLQADSAASGHLDPSPFFVLPDHSFIADFDFDGADDVFFADESETGAGRRVNHLGVLSGRSLSTLPAGTEFSDLGPDGRLLLSIQPLDEDPFAISYPPADIDADGVLDILFMLSLGPRAGTLFVMPGAALLDDEDGIIEAALDDLPLRRLTGLSADTGNVSMSQVGDLDGAGVRDFVIFTEQVEVIRGEALAAAGPEADISDFGPGDRFTFDLAQGSRQGFTIYGRTTAGSAISIPDPAGGDALALFLPYVGYVEVGDGRFGDPSEIYLLSAARIRQALAGGLTISPDDLSAPRCSYAPPDLVLSCPPA